MIDDTAATMSDQTVVAPGDRIEERAGRKHCRGVVDRVDGTSVWFLCDGCGHEHVTQNPLHHFWMRTGGPRQTEKTVPPSEVDAASRFDESTLREVLRRIASSEYRNGRVGWEVARDIVTAMLEETSTTDAAAAPVRTVEGRVWCEYEDLVHTSERYCTAGHVHHVSMDRCTPCPGPHLTIHIGTSVAS